jgi:Polysaccharide lyase
MSRNIAAALTVVAVALVVLTGAASGDSASAPELPADQRPPAVTGEAQVGSLLTASPGTWLGGNLTYGYQWLRCDSSGASCEAIAGATASTDSLSSADAGTTLRVIVTATNGYGSAAATSTATSVVSSPTGVSVTLPPWPETSIQLLVCKFHPVGGTTCSDTDGNGGETTTLTYSLSNADSAEYLLHFNDGSADTWRPLTASPADVWFDSFPTCDPQTIQVRAKRSSDGAVDPTPATGQIVVVPYGGCATTPPPSPLPYFSEHFDGAYTYPFWTAFPNAALVQSWIPDGSSAGALRISNCAASSVGTCANGSVFSSTSTYGQLGGIANFNAADAHAGGTDSSGYGNGFVEETWYRFKVRLPLDYAPTPSRQNTFFGLHVDHKTENDARAAGQTAYSNNIGIVGDGDYNVLCPGSPMFCKTKGTNPRLWIQIAGGLTTDPWSVAVRQVVLPETITLGQWHDVVLHYVFSPDPSVGYVQWWVDGAKKYDQHVATSYRRRDGTLGYAFDAIFMDYRLWANWAASIDFDEAVWGPTAASIGFSA